MNFLHDNHPSLLLLKVTSKPSLFTLEICNISTRDQGLTRKTYRESESPEKSIGDGRILGTISRWKPRKNYLDQIKEVIEGITMQKTQLIAEFFLIYKMDKSYLFNFMKSFVFQPDYKPYVYQESEQTWL